MLGPSKTHMIEYVEYGAHSQCKSGKYAPPSQSFQPKMRTTPPLDTNILPILPPPTHMWSERLFHPTGTFPKMGKASQPPSTDPLSPYGGKPPQSKPKKLKRSDPTRAERLGTAPGLLRHSRGHGGALVGAPLLAAHLPQGRTIQREQNLCSLCRSLSLSLCLPQFFSSCPGLEV